MRYLLLIVALAATACPREEAPCPDPRFGCVEIEPGEPLALGAIITLSGPGAAVGTDTRKGIEVALDLRPTPWEVLGHPVVLWTRDERCSAVGGTEAARDLTAEEEDLVGVIGTTCSRAALGTADRILGDQGIVLVSSSNRCPALTDPAHRQAFYFRTAPNDRVEGTAMARFAAERLEASTALVLTDGSGHAAGVAEAFRAAFPGPVEDGTVSVEGAVEVPAGASAPGFVYLPLERDAGRAALEAIAASRELRGIPVGVSHRLGAELGPGDPDVHASHVVLRPGTGRAPPGPRYERELLPAYRDRFGVVPTGPFHAQAFDAATLLLDAVEAVARPTPDGGLLVPRAAVRDHLLSTEEHAGASGLLSCSDAGDCAAPAEVVIRSVEDGEPGGLWRTIVTRGEEG